MPDQNPNPNVPHSCACRRAWGTVSACVIAALFGVAAFLPSLHNTFIYDDWYVVIAHPLVNVRDAQLQPLPWYRAFVSPYWPHSPDKLYRPLTILSWRANQWFSAYPLKPEPFRAVNIAIHALTCAGVVLLTRRLTGNIAAGLLAGVLFATHPVHTEAIVPIYGRSELLGGMFGVWLLARYVRPLTDDRPRTSREIVCNSLLLAAAVFSKENAIFLWPALMAVDLWRRRDRSLSSSSLPWREWFNKVVAPSQAGFVLVVATFLFFRYLVFGWQTHMEGARTRIYEVPMAHVGPIELMLTPFRLLWLVVTNLTWPDSLCPIWSYPALLPADNLYGDVLAGMAAVVGLLVAMVVFWRRGNMAGAIIVGMLLTLAIPIQALPVARWFYAERWLYLPTVFIAAMLGWAVSRMGRSAIVAGIAIAMVLLPQSWQYGSKFADDYVVTREIVVRQPNNYQGRRNSLAVLFAQERYPEVVQAANQMLQRYGPCSDAYSALAKSYVKLKDGRRALQAVKQYQAISWAHPSEFLTTVREEALALIAQQQQATTRQATAPASAPASRSGDGD
jgi:hypothetical protein